jgi:DNA uptake protein ComE-like DNA-binding protein
MAVRTGAKKRSGAKKPAEIEDWLVVDGSARRAKRKPRKPAKPAKATKPRASGKSSRSEWLPPAKSMRRRAATGNGRGRSAAPNGRGRSQSGSVVEALERRVAELERELRAERKRAQAEVEKLRARLGDPKGAVARNGRVDANSASFEQLRALGLSPTQCTKLIAHRESTGGFKAKAELRRIPGLSKSARELIEKRVSVRR